MKNNRLLWGLLSIFAFAACTNSEVDDPVAPQPQPQQKQQVVIQAIESSDSRAIHGTEEDHTSFTWQKGVDKIGVVLGHYEEAWGEWWNTDHYRFTNTTDGEKATFLFDGDPDAIWELPELEPGQTIVAYYPYGSAVSSWYDVSKPYLRSSLGALLQKGDNNTEHLYHGDYMYSKPITLKEEDFDSEGNLTLEMEFGHIFSKVRFAVKNSTSRELNINSLVYRSTKEDDILQGTLCLDATTGLLALDNLGDWGGVPPSNSAVLEVEDVVLAPGESATLWMWMLPLDFTPSNPDGRKVDIMVNTSAGVFRVQNVNFNTRMVSGSVYRQGMELTEEKLLADYAYISDPNFATILYFGNMMNDIYDEEGNFIGGGYCPLYDLDLNPFPVFDDEHWDTQFTAGCYLKISECASLEMMYIDVNMNNALSLDGLQYFTGLKELDINLGTDSDPAMSLRALKFGTLTQLESFNILQARVTHIDFSKNTELRSIALGEVPMLEKIEGLDKLTKLEGFGIGGTMSGFELDLSVCPSLKDVSVNSYKPLGSLNLSNLQLDQLSLDIVNIDALISTNLSCAKLENFTGKAFPSGAPQGVKELHLSAPYGEGAPMMEQLGQMTEIEYFELGGDFPAITFTPAQASVKKLVIYAEENNTILPTGWSNLTGVEELTINEGSLQGKWRFEELDLSGMTSLLKATIKVKEIRKFISPASVKMLHLTFDNEITYQPSAALEDLTINSLRGAVEVGNGPALKKLHLIGEAETGESGVAIGACPELEDLTITVDSKGYIDFKADKYPSLTSYRISRGTGVTAIPSATVFPKLEQLRISESVGISNLDLSDYSELKLLSVYESKFGYGSITISSAQRDYAQANEGAFTGISSTSVSPIYKVE